MVKKTHFELYSCKQILGKNSVCVISKTKQNIWTINLKYHQTVTLEYLYISDIIKVYFI